MPHGVSPTRVAVSNLLDDAELLALAQRMTTGRLTVFSSRVSLPGLTDISVMAALLPGLRQLHVSYSCNMHSDCMERLPLALPPALTELVVESPRLRHIPEGSLPTGLIRLELTGSRLLSALPALDSLSALTWLNLYGNTNLTSLPNMPGSHELTWLHLRDCARLTGISPLTACMALESLNAYGCLLIQDLTPLMGLGCLLCVDASYCPVNDLAPLSALTRLQRLSLRSTAVTDLTPLVGLTKLEELDVDCCRSLTDLAPLAGLTTLLKIT